MITTADYIEILSMCTGPAIIGAAMTGLRHARKGSTQGIVVGGLTSIVVSVITGCLLDYLSLTPAVTFGLIGLSAYSGGTLLDAILWRAEKEIKTAKLPGIKSREDD